MADPSPHALVAHVLRRCTFGPSPAQVARFADGAKDAAAAANASIDWALSAKPQGLNPEKLGDDPWTDALRGWVDTMRSPESGLHEKLVWFWHGHFATSSDKVGNMVMLRSQQSLFRTHALGSFRALLRAITTDAAMLLYLDGAGSSVEAPNENHAREMLELFTLGRGAYTEADVKSGALALAGWDVDYDTGKVTRDPERSLGGEVVFLGRRGRLSVDDVVETVLAQPACAVFVASKLHRYLSGDAPSTERAAELGAVFREGGYEIRPLVENIVRHPSFLSARMNRPKFPIEWYIGAGMAIGEPREGEEKDLNPWTLEELDQLPFRPPNVAGWPISAKWLSASQQLARAAYVSWVSWRMRPIESEDLVAAVLARCAIHECSGATRDALHQAAMATAGAADALSVSRRLLTAALLSPEFALA